MERGHNPNQPTPRFDYVQSSGVHYGAGADQRQNLSSPGQSLPPPPPLVRHGHTPSPAPSSATDNLNTAVDEHFRRALDPFASSNIASRNGNIIPSSAGNSMGSINLPNQSNTRFSYPNLAQSSTQQYGPNWRGPTVGDIRHKGTMMNSQTNQLIRQALGHEYNASCMQQDKQTSFTVPQSQGQIPGGAGQQYGYGGLPNQMNIGGTQVRFPNSCRMPNNMTQNDSTNLRHSGQNFPSSFSSPSEMQWAQRSGLNANNYAINHGHRMPPPAHQNVPQVPSLAHQQQPGTMMPSVQGHNSVNSRQAHVSSAYGMVTQCQSNYVMGSRQGHISQGQVTTGMMPVQGQGFISQGQNSFDVNSVQRAQNHYVQGQSNLHQQDQQQPRVSIGAQGPQTKWPQQGGFVNISEAAASLSQLGGNRELDSRQRLLNLKEKLLKNGIMRPGDSFPSVLAKYAIRERDRRQDQQLQTHAMIQNMTPQTPVGESVAGPYQPMKGHDFASAIQTAFAIPQYGEAHDKSVLGRWYAPPTTKLGMPKQPFRTDNNSFSNIDNSSTRQSVTIAAGALTTGVGLNPSTETNQRREEPFVLRPTVCNDEVVEYKVADLLRCLPQSVKLQLQNIAEQNKTNEQSNDDSNQALNQSQPRVDSDNSGQREEPVSPINNSGPPAEPTEKETGKIGSRELTPDSDEQLIGFDINARKVLDELVLDSQFGTQDMNPEIDYRNYLPSPGLPADFSPSPSPVLLRDTESPFPTFTFNQNNIEPDEVPNAVGKQNEEMSSPSHKDVEDNTNALEHQGEKELDVEPEVLPEPTVEIDKDESPIQMSKKRKYGSISDSSLGQLTPPVKRQRGRGRGRGRGSRGRGKVGKSWAVNLILSNKKNKPVVGFRRQTARSSRGRGRGGKAKKALVEEANESPVTQTGHLSSRSQSPQLASLDGQVIQIPQNLKSLMDNLPHEELQKQTVSLSTLKMMLAWSEVKANAGLEAEDQESDAVSIASADEAENDADQTDKTDVTSEMNNKEHNRYEPPAEGDNEDNRGEIEGEGSRSEDTESSKVKENQDVVGTFENVIINQTVKEKKSPLKKSKVKSKVTETIEKEKEMDNSKNKSNGDSRNTDSNTVVNEKRTDDIIDSENKEEHITANVRNEPLDIESCSSAQIYYATNDHKMTWVRYHGRAVTLLITPEGKFFIMKEILKRCFRIQDPNKSLKFNKIGILKRKELKIPDIELDPVFHEYVVKNLLDRKVIKTVPDKFIVISLENANRLFHYVCKDQYCGNACVTPFSKKQSSSKNDNSEVASTSETRAELKKERNLFDSFESETLSPKSERKLSRKSQRKKGRKHQTAEVINLCSDDEHSDGYESDKTLPYVDGTASSFDELEDSTEDAVAEATKSKEDKKDNQMSKKTISSNSSSESTDLLVNESGNCSDKVVNKSNGNKSSDLAHLESKVDDVLDESISGQKSIQAKSIQETVNMGAADIIGETSAKNGTKICDKIDNTTGKRSNSTEIVTKETEKSKASYEEIIISDDDGDEDISFSETAEDQNSICKVTLEKMKKEIGSAINIIQTETEKESFELVQVHNIDSTAVCAENSDRSNVLKSDKHTASYRKKRKQTSVSDKEKVMTSKADHYGINDSSISDIDSILKSDTVMDIDLTEDDDEPKDVRIGNWVFPSPPKLYPEDGTKKLEEANETLQRIIERANSAKKTEDFVDVLDAVFKLKEPIKQWTNTLFDTYEEELKIEAQRLKSLDQLKLKDISNTIDLVDDDVEMEPPRENDSV